MTEKEKDTKDDLLHNYIQKRYEKYLAEFRRMRYPKKSAKICLTHRKALMNFVVLIALVITIFLMMNKLGFKSNVKQKVFIFIAILLFMFLYIHVDTDKMNVLAFSILTLTLCLITIQSNKSNNSLQNKIADNNKILQDKIANYNNSLSLLKHRLDCVSRIDGINIRFLDFAKSTDTLVEKYKSDDKIHDIIDSPYFLINEEYMKKELQNRKTAIKESDLLFNDIPINNSVLTIYNITRASALALSQYIRMSVLLKKYSNINIYFEDITTNICEQNNIHDLHEKSLLDAMSKGTITKDEYYKSLWCHYMIKEEDREKIIELVENQSLTVNTIKPFYINSRNKLNYEYHESYTAFCNHINELESELNTYLGLTMQYIKERLPKD